MKKLEYFLMKHWYRLEYRFCMVDAHLAQLRGDKVEAANCIQFAYNAKRQLEILDLNRRFA